MTAATSSLKFRYRMRWRSGPFDARAVRRSLRAGRHANAGNNEAS